MFKQTIILIQQVCMSLKNSMFLKSNLDFLANTILDEDNIEEVMQQLQKSLYYGAKYLTCAGWVIVIT